MEERIVIGYDFIRLIDGGGMADVYLARKEDVGKLCAVKVLSADLAKEKQFVRRFVREARTLARLQHPNIVPVIDIGKTTDNRYYIVMEFIDGVTVDELIERRGRLSEEEALGLTLQVTDALDYAYEQGIVHRDIKPSNIIVDKDGVARLCDFGLAKPISGEQDITLVGLIVGTPEYLSPEQAHGKIDVDVRSDMYSLGASLYHMLVGRPPFEGRTASETAAMHITHELSIPDDVDITPATRSLINWMMRKSPDERPQTPKEVKKAIMRILSGKTHSIMASTTATVIIQRLKRRLKMLLESRLALTVAAAFIAAALVVLGLILR